MADKDEVIKKLSRIPDVGEKRAEILYENGFESPGEIAENGLSGLAEVSQIGFQTAKKIIEGAEELESKEEFEASENSEEEVGGLEGEIEELEQSLSVEENREEEEISKEETKTAEEEKESEDLENEIEAIEDLQETIEEGDGDREDRSEEILDESESEESLEMESSDNDFDIESELGGLLETIEKDEESEVEPDLEVAKEIDEWIEDTVGIKSHVGEESKCPVCGEIVSIYQDRCDRCGVEFVNEEVKCEGCGTSIDPKSVRCPECGEALVDEKTKCPICGAIVYSTENSCPECGTEFYEDKIRCDECKSTVPKDAIVCPNCETILRQKIMEEHISDRMEVSSEKTEIDIGGMDIRMQGAPETPAGESKPSKNLGQNHSTESGRILFPFPAIVNQEDMKKALLLNAINQDIGGVLIEGHRGTAKSVAIRGLAEILPDIEVIEDCRFSCDPKNPSEWCWECEDKYGDVSPEEIPVETRPVKVIDLPLNATEDRVVGTLDVEKMMQEGVKAFQEGILAEVNRGILYVDEINLLDDYIVDVLLDAAAMGKVTVEREDISITYPSDFILVGSMNPEEGALRPQLLDRLALDVKVEGITDSEKRKEIIKRRERFNDDPSEFRESWKGDIKELKENLNEAQERLDDVEIPDKMDDIITNLSVDFEVDGHRADIIMKRAARTNAAFEGREEVTKEDITIAAKMALPHRMRKGPLEENEFSVQRLKRLVRQYS